MKTHLGGTLLMVLALFAAPAAAGDGDASGAGVSGGVPVYNGFAAYGRVCSRFFGEGTPLNVGRHLGSGRLATGERLTQPTAPATLGWRMGTARDAGRSGRVKRQPGPATVGWRLNAAGQTTNNLQFCRTGPATIARRMQESGGSAAVRGGASQAQAPKAYEYRPVTYRPYGLD